MESTSVALVKPEEMRGLQATARLALSKLVECWAPPPASVLSLVSALPPAATSMASLPSSTPPGLGVFSLPLSVSDSSQGLQFHPLSGLVEGLWISKSLTCTDGEAEAGFKEPRFMPALCAFLPILQLHPRSFEPGDRDAALV